MCVMHCEVPLEFFFNLTNIKGFTELDVLLIILHQYRSRYYSCKVSFPIFNPQKCFLKPVFHIQQSTTAHFEVKKILN